MVNKLKTRLAREESGFTLIELLVVLIILAILLAIAIPSYLSFKDRANKTAAMADVRSLIPSVESFNADSGPGVGYTGMTIAGLKTTYDQAIPVNDSVAAGDATAPVGVTIPAPGAATYCAVAAVGNWYAWKLNPDGVIKADKVAANVCK